MARKVIGLDLPSVESSVHPRNDRLVVSSAQLLTHPISDVARPVSLRSVPYGEPLLALPFVRQRALLAEIDYCS